MPSRATPAEAIPIAVIALDLDRFKRINDTFGHATGDKVLRVFADVLQASVRPTNLVARLGGEEFVAVIPDTGNEVAVAIANRIRAAFQKAAYFIDGQKLEATTSAGVATTEGQPRSLAEVLASADAALYRAEAAGRNCVVLAEQPVSNPPPRNLIRVA
jgi:diguanylate cyclase (GGDEF)-like protein